MEYAGNQELRRIRNGSLLFLALCSCSGVLLVWLERKRCLAQTGAALYDLYGEQSRTILLSMMAESSQTVLIGAVVWFVLLSVGCFLYVNHTVSRLFHKICGLSLAMEQIAAGRKPEMVWNMSLSDIIPLSDADYTDYMDNLIKISESSVLSASGKLN